MCWQTSCLPAPFFPVQGKAQVHSLQRLRILDPARRNKKDLPGLEFFRNSCTICGVALSACSTHNCSSLHRSVRHVFVQRHIYQQVMSPGRPFGSFSVLPSRFLSSAMRCRIAERTRSLLFPRLVWHKKGRLIMQTFKQARTSQITDPTNKQEPVLYTLQMRDRVTSDLKDTTFSAYANSKLDVKAEHVANLHSADVVSYKPTSSFH